MTPVNARQGPMGKRRERGSGGFPLVGSWTNPCPNASPWKASRHATTYLPEETWGRSCQSPFFHSASSTRLPVYPSTTSAETCPSFCLISRLAQLTAGLSLLNLSQDSHAVPEAHMDDAQERERQAVRLSGDVSGRLATAMSGQTFQLMAPALDDDIGLQPLVPDASENHEEPTLPPHPTPSEREQAPCLALNKRKRSTVSQLMSDSSEMPIFSSDDDPAAENYRDGHGRQKRQYTGSWDRQEPLQESDPRAASPASRTRRKLERQVDSGIFMGSDASLDSAFDVPLPAPPAWRLPGPQFTQVPRSSRPLSLSPAEAEARRRIQQCIDADSEAVDLS